MALRNIIASRQTVVNSQGHPLAGGSVFLYEPGTTTFITAYADSGLVTQLSQPVRLSGSGRAEIWITRDCDLIITDRNGNTVITEDNANPDSLGGFSSGLVPNGSFEDDDDANTVPDGWVLVSEAGATNAIDNTESTDGANSFRFTSSGSGGGSLTTENFFPVNDADNLEVQFDILATVAAVRNIVRVEWYDITQTPISNSDPYDSTANPLIWTTEQFSVVPPALARFAKLRLIGIDPSVLLAGSTYFDRINVFYPAVVSGVFDNITIQDNEIITTNLNGDLELAPNGTGKVWVNSGNNGLVVVTDINTATPPVAEAVTGSFQIMDNELVDLLAHFGYIGSNVLRMQNLMEGGQVQMIGTQVGATVVSLITADPDGLTNLRYGATNVIRAQMAAGGVVTLHSDANTDTENRLLSLRHQDGTQRGYYGYVGSTVLNVVNQVPAGHIILTATNTGAAARVVLNADPDGAVNIYNPQNNVIRAGMGTAGINLHSDGNTDTEDRQLRLVTQAGTLRGRLGFAAAAGTLLDITNLNHAGHLRLSGENTGGTATILANFDPDDAAILYQAGAETARTRDGGFTIIGDATDVVLDFYSDDGLTQEGFIQIQHAGAMTMRNNIDEGTLTLSATNTSSASRNLFNGDPDGNVNLYYPPDNQIQARCVDADADANASGMDIMHTDGTLRSAGFNEMPTEERDASSSVLRVSAGKILHTDASAPNFTLPNTATIPNGAMWMHANETGAASIGLTGASGVTIRWFTGATVTSVTAGTRNVAYGGICTVYKYSATEYWIWGIGIS